MKTETDDRELEAFIRKDYAKNGPPDKCIMCYWLRYWFDEGHWYKGHYCSQKPEVRGTYDDCNGGHLKGCPYDEGGNEMTVQQLTIHDAMAEKEQQINRIVAQAKRKKSKTQADKVIEFINRNGSITQKDANILGVFRLAARVYDINNSLDPKYAGIHIVAEPDEELNQDGEMVKFARYRFAEVPGWTGC